MTLQFLYLKRKEKIGSSIRKTFVIRAARRTRKRISSQKTEWKKEKVKT